VRSFVLAIVVAAAAVAIPSTGRCAASRLLLSQVAAAPTAGEYISIYNPNDLTIDLSDYYLSDSGNYFKVVLATAPDAGDFIARFPGGASIAPRATIVIAIDSAANFTASYGSVPEYQLSGSIGAPAMLAPFIGAISDGPSLTNAGEMAILFYWDGISNLVTDVDYVAYGTPTAANVMTNKAGITINDSTYQADTADAPTLHAPLSAGAVLATCRRDFAETGQTASGGNGVGGADESSEPSATTWQPCSLPLVPDRIFADPFDV